MAENLGRSIQSNDDYLNQSFLYVPETSIRADWILIRKRLITALNSTANNDVSFDDWIVKAQQHYSLVSSMNSLNKEWRAKQKENERSDKSTDEFNRAVDKVYKGNETANVILEDNKRLIDEQREADQALIAKNILTWMSGKFDINYTEDYPYLKTVQKLTHLRQKKGAYVGSLSFNAVSDLRNDYDSHMYWLHYINPYMASDDKAIPPRPGSDKPYVRRAVMELVHELDGLINIFMTLAPMFEFHKLLEHVPKKQLEVLLNNTLAMPSDFTRFKEWLLPEFKFANTDTLLLKQLTKEAAIAWFCVHWINSIYGVSWQNSLLSIYEGQVEDLFLSLIEACKQGAVIKEQINKNGAVNTPEITEIISKASRNISHFVSANYIILQDEKIGKKEHGINEKTHSEYEKLFLTTTNEALQKRALRVGRVLRKYELSESPKSKKLDLYTRVVKSQSIATRGLPFIFYFSDMRKRYHHWFSSSEDRLKAEDLAKEKLDFGHIETGEKYNALIELENALVDDLFHKIFSFNHVNTDVKQLKNSLAAALLQKIHCSPFSANSESDVFKYLSLALEKQLVFMNINDRTAWNDIVENVEAHISVLHTQYNTAGFDTLANEVSDIVYQLTDYIVQNAP